MLYFSLLMKPILGSKTIVQCILILINYSSNSLTPMKLSWLQQLKINQLRLSEKNIEY